MKKFIATVIVTLMVMALVPIAGLAADIGEGSYNIGNAASGETINVSGSVTLTGTNNVHVLCADGTTLTLDDVTIDASGVNPVPCAVEINGTCTLIVKGTVTLTSGDNMPGIRVAQGNALTIQGDDLSTLTVQGGASGAGIGGGYAENAGGITIESGTVNATGGGQIGFVSTCGAGIGGGGASWGVIDCAGNGGVITITGGTVNAQALSGAAGIGGGASAGEGKLGGGIGGNITISGGDVTAQGGSGAPGIGSGIYADGGIINISDGTIHATGGTSGAGIGGGMGIYNENKGGDGGTINITGGNITAISPANGSGAGIGGGLRGGSGHITIDGGVVVATGGEQGGAGIGNGERSCIIGTAEEVGSITIISGDITTWGGSTGIERGGAGIGAGESSTIGPIEIRGGTIHATGANVAPGIGGTETTSCFPITISGGNITAQGGSGTGAGIGSAGFGKIGPITISGGYIDATGGVNGPGIGGRDVYLGDGITISGGTVSAVSPCGSGGLGYAATSHASVTITGGLVYAKSDGVDDDITYDPFGGSCNISGNAEVFLYNDKTQTAVTTSTHAHEPGGLLVGDLSQVEETYRFSVDDEWKNAAGGWFVERAEYTVTYNEGEHGTISGAAGGETSETVYEGASVSHVPIPTADTGYTFSSWKCGELIYTKAEIEALSPTSDMTFNAQYEQHTYTVTYHEGDHGTIASGNTETVGHGNSPENVPEPVADSGWSFSGWKSGEPTYTKAQVEAYTVTDAITFTAQYIEAAEPAPSPSASPSPSSGPSTDPTQYGTISTVVTDANGHLLAGVTVELHSTVRTAVTDANGRVTFENVPLVDHTLIIIDTDDDEIGRVALNMQKGTVNKTTMSGNDVDITFNENAVSVDIEVSLSDGDTVISIDEVSIISNPQTGDSRMEYWWIFIAVIIISAIAVGVMIKRRTYA